jgi:hypothetical protein
MRGRPGGNRGVLAWIDGNPGNLETRMVFLTLLSGVGKSARPAPSQIGDPGVPMRSLENPTMNQAKDGSTGGSPRPRDGDETELQRAQELLARTVRFLQHCEKDPFAALAAENPRELIRELEELRDGPAEADGQDEPAAEPRTIPLRRRRSA